MLSLRVISEIEEKIGYCFSNKSLLVQAFTRSSYRHEHPNCPDNEVLELIGDSVLSLTVLTYFQEEYTEVSEYGLLTDWNEGRFSALKNALVNKHRLAACMEQLGLQKHLLVSRGDAKSDIEREASVKEDLFESIIGAIYVDSGKDFARTAVTVRKMLDIRAIVEESRQKLHISHRNDLQEWCQHKSRRLQAPVYTCQQRAENCFVATVRIPEIALEASAEAQSSKIAYELAAKSMLDRIAQFPEKQFDAPAKETVNFVGRLLEEAQKRKMPSPVFSDLSDDILPDHSHVFTVEVRCLGATAQGSGSSKQIAKHAAAKALLIEQGVL